MFVHRLKKQTRDMYEQMYNSTSGEQQRKETRRKGGWSSPIKRRKKIDPAVGEYVKFQEIKETGTSQSTPPPDRGGSTYTVESQITDAEWEEIN